jgi:hypothetical protein
MIPSYHTGLLLKRKKHTKKIEMAANRSPSIHRIRVINKYRIMPGYCYPCYLRRERFFLKKSLRSEGETPRQWRAVISPSVMGSYLRCGECKSLPVLKDVDSSFSKT